MALDQEVAPICWAEIANDPKQRIFAAFKWENGVRVQSKDPNTGAPLYDRRPLRAHYGNNLTGVRDAGIVSTEMYLRHDGIVTNVKINNSPAHHVDGDDRYQRNITRKARHFGWIKVGECPALQVSLGAIEPHRILAESARVKPCSHEVLGKHNPPCPHFLAEYEARSKRSAATPSRGCRTPSKQPSTPSNPRPGHPRRSRRDIRLVRGRGGAGRGELAQLAAGVRGVVRGPPGAGVDPDDLAVEALGRRKMDLLHPASVGGGDLDPALVGQPVGAQRLRGLDADPAGVVDDHLVEAAARPPDREARNGGCRWRSRACR